MALLYCVKCSSSEKVILCVEPSVKVATNVFVAGEKEVIVPCRRPKKQSSWKCLLKGFPINVDGLLLVSEKLG